MTCRFNGGWGSAFRPRVGVCSMTVFSSSFTTPFNSSRAAVALLVRHAGSFSSSDPTHFSRKSEAIGITSRNFGSSRCAWACITTTGLRPAEGKTVVPVSKEMINRAGIAFSGHTELLAESFGVEVMMLMKGPLLSVALATNHLPISKVPGALSIAKLVKQLQLLSDGLAKWLGHAPSIAVCGLNPHAGDGGVLGSEEQLIISPAIALAKKKGLDVHGPFAADGLFATAARKFPFDVALAMFHDQGLVATKTLDFARTVNVTLGLPLPRTSPDHGVAYDIAGKNEADPTPMISALLETVRGVRTS